MDNIEGVLNTVQVVLIGMTIANFLQNTGRLSPAIKVCEECLILLNSQALDKDGPITDSILVKRIYTIMAKAKEKFVRELLLLHQDSDDTFLQGRLNMLLATTLQDQSKFAEAREIYERAIKIMKTNDDKIGKAICYGNLATLLYSFREYDKCKKYLEKALAIKTQIGDRVGEAMYYRELGKVSQLLGNYDKAQEYYMKALTIRTQIGDKEGEAVVYRNLGTVFQSLGTVFQSLGNDAQAQEYHEKALAISLEIGDRKGEAASYGNLGTVFQSLGTVFQSLGNYAQAQENHEKALAISLEIGDGNGQGRDYGNLGRVFQSLGNYAQAQEYHEKALAISLETSDRKGEVASYGNLGRVFQSLGYYAQAQEYHEKALAISLEIGDRKGEAASYENLGTVFQSLGNYDQAQEYQERALAISLEIGDRKGEAASYGNLGTVFQSLGNYDQAQKYHEKALAINLELCDRNGKKNCYINLGALFLSLGKYPRADKYLVQALAIAKEIGDKHGEAVVYGNLGIISRRLRDYEKAQEYYEKALAIFEEIGYRDGEAVEYLNLGACFQSLGMYNAAEKCIKRALLISKNIGHNLSEFKCLCQLTLLKLSQFNFKEAMSYLFQCIGKFDTLRGFLKDNDHFKTSLLEEHGNFPYKLLSKLLSSTGEPRDALYVEELRRARGLADFMAAKYSVQELISGNPQSWHGIQNIIPKETDCTCLYISVEKEHARYWILEASGAIHFSRKKVSLEKHVVTQLVPDLDEFFTKSFRSLGILPQQNCEDRSLDDTESMPPHYDNRGLMRDYDPKDFKINLQSCYEIIIAPMANLLKEPEIVIVPESCMYQVPFAAISDEGGKYLADTFRIRVVPSLTTLKLIQDSSPDYHSQRGALIVGDPEVGEVLLKGRCRIIASLPCARKEAEMIGRLLGATPLTGDRATKEAVLDAINSVSLIHFAAHGDAERGEIALSPNCPTNFIPQDENYLLTMADISKLRLRAKLVVLSCCHSARGQIKAEGIIGIARAFLGSGARSVLAARWAIEDTATEEFMRCFYQNLFRGKSASESLHEARKWLREHGFEKVSQWAPFMLMGDNVTFDFENWPVSETSKQP
nr:tetratricopeptide repeat protein 28-like [Pocillopora verrucosa]